MKQLRNIFIFVFCIAFTALLWSGSHLSAQSHVQIPVKNEKGTPHPTFELEHAHIQLMNCTESGTPLFVRSSQLLRAKIGKFSTFSHVISTIGWQAGYGIVSNRTLVFQVYTTRLFRSIPDPRLHLLSSRAHPPTQGV